MFAGKGFALSLSAVGLLGLGSVCQPSDILGSAGVNELSGSMVSFVLSGQTDVGNFSPLLDGGKGIERRLSDPEGGGVLCCEGAGYCDIYQTKECPSGTTEVTCPCGSTS